MATYPTTREFLDQLARRIAENEGQAEPVSDYRLAQILKVTKQSVSQWRTGKKQFGDVTGEKVAELLNLDPLFVVSCIHAERAQNVALRRLWYRAADAGKITAKALILGLVLAGAVHTGDVRAGVNENIHYAQRRRRGPRFRLNHAPGHA